MKNVIFLDIDGVLNNRKSRKERKCNFHYIKYLDLKLEKRHLDLIDACMERIIKLINEFDAHIVITSMWRFSAKVQWFIELFQLYGLDLDISKIDMLHTSLCEQTSIGTRSLWIEEYLNDNPCDNFVMIDDTKDHYDRLHDKLVLTDIEYGFTEHDYEKAVAILK